MKEHVHEWALCLDGAYCVWAQCDYRLTMKQIEARLNATEMLRVGIDELKDACKDDPTEMGGPFVSLSWVERTLEGK